MWRDRRRGRRRPRVAAALLSVTRRMSSVGRSQPRFSMGTGGTERRARKTTVEFLLGLFSELDTISIAPTGPEPTPHAPLLKRVHSLGKAQHAGLRLFDLQQGREIFQHWPFERHTGAGFYVFQHQIERIVPFPALGYPSRTDAIREGDGGICPPACRAPPVP